MRTRRPSAVLLVGALSLLALTGCGQRPVQTPDALTGDPHQPTSAPATSPATAPTTSPSPTATAAPKASTKAKAHATSRPKATRSSERTRVLAEGAPRAGSKRPEPAKRAPVSAVRVPSVVGRFSLYERPFSANAPANRVLPAGVEYGSADGEQARNLRRSGGTAINSTSWGVTILQARTSDPFVAVRRNGSDDVLVRIHFPSHARVPGGSDKAVAVVAPDGHTAYEFYKLSKRGSGWSAKYVKTNDLRGTGDDHGARASNTSLLWGIIRQADLREGLIAHSLVMGIPNSALKSGFVSPANAQDGDAARLYHGTIPMGTRFAIPRNADLRPLHLSKRGRVLAAALQQYGAYVMRRSDSVALYAESSADQGAVSTLRGDWAKLRPLLRPVHR